MKHPESGVRFLPMPLAGVANLEKAFGSEPKDSAGSIPALGTRTARRSPVERKVGTPRTNRESGTETSNVKRPNPDGARQIAEAGPAVDAGSCTDK